MQSRADIATDKAARYMTQLTKHWGHRFQTELAADHARIDLPGGPCRMTADDTELHVSIEAGDAEQLARMEQVVAEHLARFAFREPDLRIVWARTDA